MLVSENDKLILIDTGIGLLDTLNPIERIGQQLINIVGYRFDENQTAVRQIENLGLDPEKVTDCIISHLDNHHIGGLADFPKATVHLSVEELNNFNPANPNRNPAYLQGVFIHRPNNDGWAGTFNKDGKTHGVSEGCLLIAPTQWTIFNNQLKTVNSFMLQINR